MGKKEKERNPLQSWHKKEKEKVCKARKKGRIDKIAEIPAHRRDPAPLIPEIYKLSVLEYEGRLNGDLKMRKKHLLDQYHSIKKARSLAGLETIELAPFDSEAYESEKLKRRQKTHNNNNNPIKSTKPTPKLNNNSADLDYSDLDLNENGFPFLPTELIPSDEQLLSLNLPLYSSTPYLPDLPDLPDLEEEEEQNENQLEDFEKVLQAEYYLFKEGGQQDNEEE